MFDGIFNVLKELITGLVYGTVGMIDNVFTDIADPNMLDNYDVNLSLFSDIPILSINMYDLLSLFFTFFYSMFFIVLLYKTTKKVIKSVFGVLKWW